MAEKVKSPRMGIVYKIENKEAKPTEKREYIAVNVEDENGKNERWLLLTEREYLSIPRMECNGVFKGMKPGRLIPFDRKNNPGRTLLTVWKTDDGIQAVRLAGADLREWEKRAAKNPEDLPKKGLLANLLD